MPPLFDAAVIQPTWKLCMVYHRICDLTKVWIDREYVSWLHEWYEQESQIYLQKQDPGWTEVLLRQDSRSKSGNEEDWLAKCEQYERGDQQVD